MCVAYDSVPPIAPVAGAAVLHRDLELASSDGTRFAAFFAAAERPSGSGMVVLPDVRGLFRFYEELALRFAEAGINAVAIDYFGRTAGVAKRGEDFPFMDHVAKTTNEAVAADVAAAVAFLRSPEGGSCRSVFTVGFCFGGRHSWFAAMTGQVQGAIGFYGQPGVGRDGSPGPAQRAAELKAPILALMAGADQGIPLERIAEFEQALQAAGRSHDVVVYPGAPHSFFDRRYADFATESTDAWERVLAFVRANAGA